MQATVGQIAVWTRGEVCGDASVELCGLATIDRAGPGTLTFANGKTAWDRFLRSPAAAAVVSGLTVPRCDRPVVVVPDAEAAFAALVSRFQKRFAGQACGVSPHALISSTARIGQNVTIEAGAFVGNEARIGDGCRILSGARIMEGCVLGRDVTIFPNVVVYDHCTIGERVLIHAGAVIGAYGFGYRTRAGRHELGPQLGRVLIGDDVEIGANTTIDRGTFDDTVIGEGSKLDDQVMIGHNCVIGRHNLICSQVGIAGSSRTGDHVVMAGQVGIGDHLEIGDRVTLCAKAGVMHSIPAGETHAGAPSMPAREQLQLWALTGKLPELKQRIRELEAAIKQLAAIHETGAVAHRAA
jgi:UDP-3-O-[3-hydroxymyristoyl] glucosamine N-acyltransferase